ncbi:hypothetical protein [Mycoplasma miroungirhinis]|uniref:Uncharacterized protein n=1 Tax=Mycoplasma miroungirhinis TaxID=754516 RepID=A0A6M4JD90_9MOLU|nr:hypothetical protein [Mycoplasma miroungirhinis]QJR44039.1 hypothetical protein HLA92_01125 [Mycoplasma miroungirhinis]
MKKTLNKKYLWVSLISLFSSSAIAGVIYFVYYNAKITHIEKYSDKEYQQDQEKIILSPTSFNNIQSAQQIFNNFQIWKKNNPNEPVNKFISGNVNIKLTPRQQQNMEITFTDLKYDENDAENIIVDLSIQDKKHKFKKINIKNRKINIYNSSYNYENNDQLKIELNKNKNELKNIISNSNSTQDNYFSSEAFKNAVFQWFIKIANQNRPNIFSQKDYDIVKADNEDYVKYTTKSERNLLVIDFNFVSKDKKIIEKNRIQYYVS